jgi:hypothetical protein
LTTSETVAADTPARFATIAAVVRAARHGLSVLGMARFYDAIAGHQRALNSLVTLALTT